MALSRRERLALLKSLALIAEYQSLLMIQPKWDKDKNKKLQAVSREIKLVLQDERHSLFPPPKRCPACGQDAGAAGMGEGEGQ